MLRDGKSEFKPSPHHFPACCSKGKSANCQKCILTATISLELCHYFVRNNISQRCIKVVVIFPRKRDAIKVDSMRRVCLTKSFCSVILRHYCVCSVS